MDTSNCGFKFCSVFLSRIQLSSLPFFVFFFLPFLCIFLFVNCGYNVCIKDTEGLGWMAAVAVKRILKRISNVTITCSPSSIPSKANKSYMCMQLHSQVRTYVIATWVCCYFCLSDGLVLCHFHYFHYFYFYSSFWSMNLRLLMTNPILEWNFLCTLFSIVIQAFWILF